MSERAVRAVPRRGRQSGQALVEFALVVPIFFLLLLGLIDGARAVYMDSVLSQAAREGARVAAVEAAWIGSTDPSCGTLGGPVCPASVAQLRADVVAGVNRMTAPFGLVSSSNVFLSCDLPGAAPAGAWTAQTCTHNTTSNVVSVRVVMTFSPITPLASQAMGSGLTLSGAATMVIN